jgi:predicted transcriptional regulator
VSEPRNRTVRESVFPGFGAIQDGGQALIAALSKRRQSLGLSQTEVAGRMGTSQSAIARLEAGGADIRLSTLERYAAALGHAVTWHIEEDRP